MSIEKKKDLKKIIIIGLDNSGKTSIILSLQKNTNILSYFSLKPTQGLDIVKVEDQDALFSIWELGGQEKYRKNYFKDLGKYTEGADKIIFVIDVQDIPRYKLALQYLEEIVNHLQKEQEKPEIAVFLHKFDPGLEEIKNFTSDDISTRLLNRINSIIPSEFDLKIFKSTIFTVFQKTLLQ
ncbi:MAG: 50S ribosome-binding GTPase [Candidatus Helarchaeota archaeon]|nr:50S ribosome-binding GTPase [Candidatus Helarchaeota archaeon]